MSFTNKEALAKERADVLKPQQDNSIPKRSRPQPKKKESDSRVVVDFRGEERVIKDRHRLRNVEVRILEAEFQKDPRWTLKQSKALAQLLNVTQTKVYKWGYERKKKHSQDSLDKFGVNLSAMN